MHVGDPLIVEVGVRRKQRPMRPSLLSGVSLWPNLSIVVLPVLELAGWGEHTAPRPSLLTGVVMGRISVTALPRLSIIALPMLLGVPDALVMCVRGVR